MMGYDAIIGRRKGMRVIVKKKTTTNEQRTILYKEFLKAKR